MLRLRTVSRLLGGMALVWLAGCVAPPADGRNSGNRNAGRADSREIVTASDQTDTERRARVRLELASAYFSRGQAETALDEVKQALVANPNYADAYNLRGLIYGNLGNPQLAEESFRRALQLAPRDVDTMHNYGWFLCQERRFPEAQAQFAQVLAQPQAQLGVRTLLAQGVCFARGGQWNDAQRSLLRSYELDPSNPTTAVNLSEVYYHLGEYERARFYIARVNGQQQQSNAQTLWLAARIEYKAGNPGAASNFGNELRARFPQAPEALAFERGRFDE